MCVRPQPHQCLNTLVKSSLQDQPPRRLGNEPNRAQYDCRKHVYQAQRNQIRRLIRPFRSRPVDNRADERPKRDEEVKSREKYAAQLSCTAFLQVQLRKGHEVPVRKTDDEASGVQCADVYGRHHDDVGDEADDTCEGETVPTSEARGWHASGGGAEEGAEGHEGGDELLALG
jgi:hypothetical protein